MRKTHKNEVLVAAVSGNAPLPSASKAEILLLYDTAVFQIQILILV